MDFNLKRYSHTITLPLAKAQGFHQAVRSSKLRGWAKPSPTPVASTDNMHSTGSSPLVEQMPLSLDTPWTLLKDTLSLKGRTLIVDLLQGSLNDNWASQSL